MDRDPEQLVWGGDGINAAWRYNAKSEDISVDAGDILMAGLGETKAGEYRLKVNISKNAFSGAAGLFWGYSAVDPAESGFDHRCQTVILFCDAETRPPLYRIQRSLMEFRPSPHRVRPSITESSVLSTTIPKPQPGENELMIDISQGTIVAVRWRGGELPGLNDDSETIKMLTPLPSGRFGILNSYGASRFHDAQFKFVSR